jgi:transposase
VRFFHHKPGIEARFMKGPVGETIEVHVGADKNLYVKQYTQYDETLKKLESIAEHCEQQGSNGNQFSDCIASKLVKDIDGLMSSRETLKKHYRNIAARMRNYTCADESMETSESVDVVEFKDESGHQLTANVLLDTPVAKIWYVDDFATETECERLMEHGRPRLKRATIAAADGTSIVSENRKAQQAVYEFNRDDLLSDPLG